MAHHSSAGGSGFESQARLIKIDSEHFSIRFLLPILTIVLVILVHIGGMTLIDDVIKSANPLCLVLPADLVVLLFGSTLIERLLKAALPSRRTAVLSHNGLTITDARRNPPEESSIDWSLPFNVRAWRFSISRRGRRVPRGWYCMAIQLLQDETEMIVYTFMPQQEAEDAVGYSQFVRLRPRNETQSNTDLNTVAEQRRLLKLEDARWEDGAEMDRKDFSAVLGHVQRVLPDWR